MAAGSLHSTDTSRPSGRDWLQRLEAEAIHIIREAVAEARRPVLLFSAGKDSAVLAFLARRAFAPARAPLPLLHIDSTWEFRELLAFRDRFAERFGFELRVHANEAGRAAGINPFEHGAEYTRLMRTEALKQALAAGGYDVVLGGARRDEERSRAKERIVSIRGADQSWDPRRQRPELWRLYNLRLAPGQSARVFPLSNWTEADVWRYAQQHEVPLAPLYFAAERQVLERHGALIVADDLARLPPGEGTPRLRSVRFRTLGCWPVTGAIESAARDLPAVLTETLAAEVSERGGRVAPEGGADALERHKREGYF